MSSRTQRLYAPAAGAVAVVAVIAATLVVHEVGHHATSIGPERSPSHAPSYIGLRDFKPVTSGGFEPTTSGGKVMIGP
jgi:hypothetical protein